MSKFDDPRSIRYYFAGLTLALLDAGANRDDLYNIFSGLATVLLTSDADQLRANLQKELKP